jgi:phosphate transport system protein
MAEGVTKMVADAIDAFVHRDVDLAQSVIERDDEIDGQFHTITRDLLKLMTTDITLVEPCIHVQSVAKFLERIADHATNVAEFVIFLVKGKDIRHLAKKPS